MNTLFNRSLLILSILAFIATSCNKSSDDLFGTNTSETELSLKSANLSSSSSSNVIMTQVAPEVAGCGETTEIKFLAGQKIEAGLVSVFNTEDKLFVSVKMNSPWVISQTQVYVGKAALVPANKKGNPQIGQFPVKNSFPMYTNLVTYEFNLDDFEETFMVAFHADVQKLDANGLSAQSETAWADGTQFVASGSWASYFNYTKQECQSCVYETIYFDLFGGQTIPVGNLVVTNDEENLYVTYDGNNGWKFATVQLYVGSLTGLPTNNQNTPVPGSFPLKNESTSLRETVSFAIPLNTLPDCYIIAAHGEAKLSDATGNIIQSETSWSFGTKFPNTNRWGWYSSYCTQICKQ